MKHIKWRILIVTCLACLVPCVFGIFLYDSMPDVMAIHFNLRNEPDNFASKEVVLFLLPLLMAVMQAFMCVITDIFDKKHGEGKAVTVAKWLVPIITAGVWVITILFSKGTVTDIRRPIVFLLGFVYIIVGNYLPKLDYVKNYKFDTDTARRINRFSGFGFVIFGLLFLISAFLPTVVSVVCLVLFVVFIIVYVFYVTIEARKSK